MKRIFAYICISHIILIPQLLQANGLEIKDGPFIKSGTSDLLLRLKNTKARKALVSRPDLYNERIYDSPGGHFKIHYQLDGAYAVDPTDDNMNGIPDYVEFAAATFDEVWHTEIVLMGYPEPTSDGSLGGDSLYDIYIIDFSSPLYYGITVPDRGGTTSSTYVKIDNNYEEDGYPTQGLMGLQVTAAHEFFHAIHFSLYGPYEASWWMEQTAVWMEEQVYDHINDYRTYLRYFFNLPRRSLDYNSSNYKYGASIFPMFLSKKFGIDLIKDIWIAVGQHQSVDLSVFDELIPGGLGQVFVDFNRWNYFTGSRALPDSFYEEGAFFPEIDIPPEHIYDNFPVAGTSYADYMMCEYFFLYTEPWNETTAKIYADTLRLDLQQDHRRGWISQVILYNSPDDFETLFFTDMISIPQWREYSTIVFIPTQTSLTGISFSCDFTAEVRETEYFYVWPGDTDNNGVVDIRDVLNVGLYYELTGYPRENASINWTSQPSSIWDVPDGTFADGNGDGVVNMNDLEPIANNWGRIRGSNKPGTITIYEAYTQIFEALKNQPSTHFTLEAIKWAASKLGISNYPVAYELLQNHPNPFNAGTMINFVLPYYHHNGTVVHLSIYNLFGQEIVSWKLTDISMGRHSISWNTTDKHGFEAASGLYLIHFSAGDYSTNKKMLLVR